MGYAVLYGEHELTVDDKNRLLIPADVRKCLKPDADGSAFFVKVGSNKVPWLYPEKYYEYLATQAPLVINPDRDALAHAQRHFALASRLEWDKQGRILLPERILTQTGVGKDVVLIGCRDHLQLWNREAWARRRDELLSEQA